MCAELSRDIPAKDELRVAGLNGTTLGWSRTVPGLFLGEECLVDTLQLM